ncbi:MAG: hypothetical protein FD180_777 [Planctomycetota bacterium]|nr:MAG: hypothetical protein FD180_777 [Planctomycetota bacterium]
MRSFLPTLLALAAATSAFAQGGNKTSECGLQYSVNPSKPGPKRAPLIIFLHGTGGNSGVFSEWGTEAKKRGYIVALPHSTGTGDAKAGNTAGDAQPRWADVDIPKVIGLARELQRTLNGDPKRTYLGGYSNGAFYAMEIGLGHPEVFSGVLSIGGGCNLHELPADTKRLGAFIIHGTADNAVPFDAAVRADGQLRKHGLEVVFKKHEGAGHVLFPEEAKGFFDWLPKFVRPYVPGSITWEADLEKARASASEKKQRLLVWFWSAKDATSELADYFECDLLRESAIADLASTHVLVKIDRDSETAKSFALKKPALAVLDADGKVLKKFEAPADPKALAAAILKVK